MDRECNLPGDILNRESERCPPTKEQLVELFERTVWPDVPPEVLGKKLKKRGREELLGYGPRGV